MFWGEGKGSGGHLMWQEPCVLLSHSDQYYRHLTAGPYFGGVFLSFEWSQFMLRDLLTEYHEYDSLLALHLILFLNYDFHCFSKNRGWLWNATLAPAFFKSYTFLILLRFWGFSFLTGALLDQGCDARRGHSVKDPKEKASFRSSLPRRQKETCCSLSGVRSNSKPELCCLLVGRAGLPCDSERQEQKPG